MSSESVCQIAHSWVDVGSFHTLLFGAVCVTCGDFRDGSEKGIASVHHICASLGKSATETLTMIQQAFGDQSLSLYRCFNGMPGSRPVAHQLRMANPQGDSEAARFLKPLHEFKSSSVRIDFGPFTTLLRRWQLVMGNANGF